METLNILSILMIAPIGAMLALIIKKQTPSVSLALSISVAILMLLYGITAISHMLNMLNDIIDKFGVDFTVFQPMIKVTGIGIVARIASEICKDAGESGLSAKVELCATVASALVALPLFSTVLNLITGLL